jgi:hypothetical protein
MVVLAALRKADAVLLGRLALAGAALTLVSLVAYAVFIPATASAFTSVGNYFDPTHPTKVMADPRGVLSGFLTGGQAALFWGGALVTGALIPGVLAYLTGRGQGSSVAGVATAATLCALAGGLCFRAVLYALGFSVFVFY